MDHELKIASDVIVKRKRTRVIVGRRVCNIFFNTIVEDRSLISHVQNIREPDAADLTDQEVFDTIAGMYGFTNWPCKVTILDRMNAIPAAISTNYCHTGPEFRIPEKEAALQVVSTVEVGLKTELKSQKGKEVTVKGNTLTIVNDEVVMLVIPTNKERNFNGKEEMLNQAGVTDITPVVREAEVKNQ